MTKNKHAPNFNLLVPVLAEHADYLYPLLVGSKVTDTIVWDGPTSLEDFRSGLYERQKLTEKKQLHLFTILEPNANRPIGSADIRPNEEGISASIGIWVGEPYQGNGLGTKAVRELIEYGFKTLGLQTIYADIFVGNIASRKAFEKCGFEWVDTLPAALLKRGKSIDEWRLSITRDQFSLLR